MVSRVLVNKKVHLVLLLAVLLAGFSLRLSYVHTVGFESDMEWFVSWARLMARGGFGAVYGQVHSAYPPLGTAMLLPMGLMCPRCAMEAKPTIGELLILRLLSTGFDLLNAAILFQIGKTIRHVWIGLGCAALYLFFPTMVWISGWWSQNDSWFIFFMLLGGIWLERERVAPAWLCLALSALIKLQAIIVLPVFVAGTWRWFGWKRLVLGSAAFLLVIGLFCAPVLATGQFDKFVSAITLPTRQDPVVGESHITLDGHNVWGWLAVMYGLDTWGSYRHEAIPGITFQAAGLSLLLLGLAFVAARVFVGSTPSSIFPAMTVSWLVFFQFSTGVGARYLIPTTVFSLIAAMAQPAWWVPSLGLHLTTLFNIYHTIRYVRNPFPDLLLPGDVITNAASTAAFSLMAFALFFVQASRAALKVSRFQSSRFERVLTGVACVGLIIALAAWLNQSANAQNQLKQAGAALTTSIKQELDASDNMLVINWPKEISLPPSGHILSPSTGILPPSLKEMGAASSIAVIYPPWSQVVDQVHGWNATYQGYHVTTEMLVERIFKAKRVITVNMLSRSPRVWRLAEITDMETGGSPLARFDQQVQLVDAHLDYADRIVSIRLAWNVAQPLPDDVTVFVHLLGPEGQLVAQADGDTVNNVIPLGQWYRYPTRVIHDTRMLTLPPGAPDGLYSAAVGLYWRTTLERLNAICGDSPCADRKYLVGPISIGLAGK